MMLIHSLWTYPIRSAKDAKQNRLEGGWPHTRYHYLSWALSCLLAKKHHGQIDVFVDDFGKKILIEDLELPYDNVHVALNDLEKKYSPNLWTIGKTQTLALMNEPFLHIDSDVYLFDKINDEALQGGLICQNMTKNLDIYDNILSEVSKKLAYCPDYLKHDPKQDLISVNAGVLGGNNVARIHEITSEVFNLIDSNKNCIHKVDNYEMTLLIDQYMFYRFFNEKEISCLFDNVPEGFVEVLKWHTLPQQSQYIHALGYAKRNPHTIAQLECRLAFHFPAEYNKYAKKLELDNILEHKTALIERRFYGYTLLENTTFLEILEKPILLSPAYVIDEDYIINKQTGEKILLEGLDTILPVFEESTTMLEVIDYLRSQDASTTKEVVSNRVYEFIMDKIIYHDQLTFE